LLLWEELRYGVEEGLKKKFQAKTRLQL